MIIEGDNIGVYVWYIKPFSYKYNIFFCIVAYNINEHINKHANNPEVEGRPHKIT